MKILVIGAGVCGLGPAWRLAQQGHDVTVFERDHAGAGASSAAAGMLAPTAEVKFEETELLELGRESLALWPSFVDELEAESGIDVDYRREGTLVMGLDRDDLEAVDHLFKYHRELDLEVERLDGDQARELEPGLTPTAHGALYIPGDHQVDPPKVVKALVKAFQKAGGRLREEAEVAAIRHDAGRLHGLELADGTSFDADAVIIAAGAWSRKLQGLDGEDRPYVRPIKGQMISLDLGQPPLCTHVIRAPDAYLVPKSSGRLIIGATMEEMGWDDTMTAGGVFELLRGAWETLPAVYDQAILDMWTGFRPMTLDNMPLMRSSTNIAGLVYSLGHGRNGILLTPITASRVSGLI